MILKSDPIIWKICSKLYKILKFNSLRIYRDRKPQIVSWSGLAKPVYIINRFLIKEGGISAFSKVLNNDFKVFIIYHSIPINVKGALLCFTSRALKNNVISMSLRADGDIWFALGSYPNIQPTLSSEMIIFWRSKIYAILKKRQFTNE